MSLIESDGIDSNCSICCEPCVINEIAFGDIISTHCNHTFHQNCLTEWNCSGHPSACCCPICRTELIAYYIEDDQVVDANIYTASGAKIENKC